MFRISFDDPSKYTIQTIHNPTKIIYNIVANVRDEDVIGKTVYSIDGHEYTTTNLRATNYINIPVHIKYQTEFLKASIVKSWPEDIITAVTKSKNGLCELSNVVIQNPGRIVVNGQDLFKIIVEPVINTGRLTVHPANSASSTEFTESSNDELVHFILTT